MVKFTWDHTQKFAVIVLAIEILCCLFFGLFAEYGDQAQAGSSTSVGIIYPFFQDVHVMVFVGFGFLMTFLKRYSFSSVGLNFMISAVMLQWAILVNGFWHQVGNGDSFHKIKVNILSLIEGDYGAAAVLITFGAILGKVSPIQLVVIGFLEMIIYGGNFNIGFFQLQAVDMGGSMFVHTFGAYFGLAVSFMVTKKKLTQNNPLNASDYRSDMFAMIGTLFLWMFWPSFNGALATESQQFRVIINTVLALTASCTLSFVMSAFFRKGRKFDMVDIQNATLAGGVAVGSSADLVIESWGAILIGAIAGIISVLGYVYISPFLEKYIGLHDTCGVHNLHGMPGILGGIAGTFSSLIAGDTAYGVSIGKVFPARAPSNATEAQLLGLEPGKDRSAGEQAGYQFAALVVTLLAAVLGGLVVGWIAKFSFFEPPQQVFHDHVYWEVPQDIEDELEAEASVSSNKIEMGVRSSSGDGVSLVNNQHHDSNSKEAGSSIVDTNTTTTSGQ